MNNQIDPKTRKLSRYIKHNLHQIVSEATANQVTHVQARVLFYLEWMEEEKKDVYQKNIEEFLAVSKSTASELISNLENNGYISRVKEENDGRLRKIILLEKGYETNKVIGKTIQDFEKKLQSKLTEDELENFFRIVDKLVSE